MINNLITTHKIQTALLLAITLVSGIGKADAQELPDPIAAGRFAIAGFGDVTYEESDLQDSSAFSTNFVPIFLFRLSPKLHIEAELEISLNEAGETEEELEYADVHYFLNDTSTLTAGKFLLPFGQFSPNLHPSWINRTPWTPGIYGAHGSSQAMTALLPVLSDVGVAYQKIFAFNSRQKIFLDVYYTNGARAEPEGHDEEEEVETGLEEHVDELPEVEFEATSGDNNKDKAVGGRIAYAFLPGIELGASYYQASYDDAGSLDISAKGLDLNYFSDHFILRGEYIETETEGLEEEEGSIEIHNFKRDGWYLQGTFHLGSLFSGLNGTDFVVERAKVNKLEEASRWVYGFNYWLDARSVIKVAYEKTDVFVGEDDKRFAVQFSYGF